ncbi:ParB domain-containing protein nuclease [Agrobacterium tumefaciens F2]|jgi:ParB family transcriptional regulator, chromosome partitioning protein|nr:ParB domain-containing protein nuclease [Agrobacterium tumefaciens F2]
MWGIGAVSPKLMQVYRDGGLTLDQLMAFAIVDDPARQEQVYENLSYNREPWIIRRDLTKTNIAATDRRAVFVGAEAYTEAGGMILRDLFTEDRGGFYEDAALLDRLVIEKLERIAETIKVEEGWKWASVHIDYPHGNGFRRIYPHPVELSEETEAAGTLGKEASERAIVDIAAKHGLSAHDTKDLKRHRKVNGREAIVNSPEICRRLLS